MPESDFPAFSVERPRWRLGANVVGASTLLCQAAIAKAHANRS